MTPAALPDAVSGPLARLAALARARSAELKAAASAADWLYANWYIAVDEPPPTVSGDLRPRLRAALAASERWTSGWVVVHSSDTGECEAGKSGAVRRLAPGDYANLARPMMPPMPGDMLAVTDRIAWSDPGTGFWHAQSSHGSPQGDLARLYVSTPASCAPRAVRSFSAALDAVAARYALKCPADASGYARADSLVIYIEQAAWPGLVDRLVALAPGLGLRSQGPPLACPLTPGLAWAEDPGDGTSFGQRVCAALAPAAVAAADGEGEPGFPTALAAAGLPPDAPWKRASP